MLRRNVKFQNHNENADRHLNAYALGWRPFYTPGDLTVTLVIFATHKDPLFIGGEEGADKRS